MGSMISCNHNLATAIRRLKNSISTHIKEKVSLIFSEAHRKLLWYLQFMNNAGPSLCHLNFNSYILTSIIFSVYFKTVQRDQNHVEISSSFQSCKNFLVLCLTLTKVNTVWMFASYLNVVYLDEEYSKIEAEQATCIHECWTVRNSKKSDGQS